MTPFAWRALADTSVSTSDSFLQYGAVGFIALVAMAAAKTMFNKLEKQYRERDEERERELVRAHTRADRLEHELSELNASVRESMRALTSANMAVAEAMTRMRRER